MSEPKGLYYNVNKRKAAGTSRSKNNPKAPSDADWKNAAKTAKVSEAIVDHAGSADSDHEVQMARTDLYNIAHDALQLHKILKNVSEEKGLEGWQQAKITKAADYISSVYKSLNYETMTTSTKVPTGPVSNGSVGIATTMSEDNTKTMSRAAKGNEKYGKDGMKALAKAGRDGASEKELDSIRDKHDKYDDKVDEASAEKKMAYGKAAFADYHKQSKEKLGKILSGDKNTDKNTRKIANRLKGIDRSTKTESADAYKLQLAQQLDEKAKSKAQQQFMGMVHAAQKGEKPASKAVADVAKDMPKKAAKDYAATKHKGLPAHAKK